MWSDCLQSLNRKLKLSHFTFVEGLGDWITSSLLNGRLGFVWYKDLTIIVRKKMWNWEIFGYTKGKKQHLQAWVDRLQGLEGMYELFYYDIASWKY